jgi:hypothetical protein
MFNWLKKADLKKYDEHLGLTIADIFKHIQEIKKELHGWQSATYQLLDALGLDLVKDEHGNISIKQRRNI